MVVAMLVLVALGAPVTTERQPARPREVLADAVSSASTSPNRPSRRPPAPQIASDEDLDRRPVRNPVWGFMCEAGLGGGGDDLVTVGLTDGSSQTLSAGDGVAVSLGVMWTPLWLGDALGLGVSGTLGYKGWSVGASNADITIQRFPFMAAVDLLPRIGRNWLLLARGGLDKETKVSISSSGAASGIGGDLEAKLGAFAEGGVYHTYDIFKRVEVKPDGTLPVQHGASSLTVRYTKLTYTANGVSVDGQSLMFFTAFYYNL
jgi:hypothetical protein